MLRAACGHGRCAGMSESTGAGQAGGVLGEGVGVKVWEVRGERGSGTRGWVWV